MSDNQHWPWQSALCQWPGCWAELGSFPEHFGCRRSVIEGQQGQEPVSRHLWGISRRPRTRVLRPIARHDLCVSRRLTAELDGKSDLRPPLVAGQRLRTTTHLFLWQLRAPVVWLSGWRAVESDPLLFCRNLLIWGKIGFCFGRPVIFIVFSERDSSVTPIGRDANVCQLGH